MRPISQPFQGIRQSPAIPLPVSLQSKNLWEQTFGEASVFIIFAFVRADVRKFTQAFAHLRLELDLSLAPIEMKILHENWYVLDASTA